MRDGPNPNASPTQTRTDRDSDGKIDKDELAEALFRAGYRIERERFDDLFVVAVTSHRR